MFHPLLAAGAAAFPFDKLVPPKMHMLAIDVPGSSIDITLYAERALPSIRKRRTLFFLCRIFFSDRDDERARAREGHELSTA